MHYLLYQTDVMMKKVIINADDLGASKKTNKAIAQAFNEGILTSASIIVSMEAYEDAIENTLKTNKELGVGLHLSLTEGKSVVNKTEIPLLVDKGGYFNKTFMDIYRKAASKRDILHQIYKEFDAQFKKLYFDGVQIDHVDGHHHIHMIPPIFSIVVRLAKKYHCHMIRLADERFFVYSKAWYPGYHLLPLINGGIAKKILLSKFAESNRKSMRGMQKADYFFGALHSGKMDLRNLLHIFHCIKPGVTEILTHPSIYSDPIINKNPYKKMDNWLRSSGRRIEYDALLADTLRQSIATNNIKLIRFGDVISQINN